MSIVIVGAGLSGLVCARQCLKELSSRDVKITLVEARDRIGGRMYSDSGVDMGAAWSWIFNDQHLQKLSKEMKVSLEPQLTKGKSIIQGYNGAIRLGGEESPSGSGSTRFRGTASSIVKALTAELEANPSVTILKNTAVTAVFISPPGDLCPLDGEVRVSITDGSASNSSSSISANAVVFAMPPQLITSGINFNPPLAEDKRRAMQDTPTWMFQAGKVAFTYERRFWYSDKGLSGTAFSEIGPIVQAWDSSSEADGIAALAGFVFGDDLKYLRDEESLRASPVMAQMVQLFGAEAANPTGVMYKSWIDDPHTTVQGSEQTPGSLDFGHPLVCRPHEGRVFFAGTEAAKSKMLDSWALDLLSFSCIVILWIHDLTVV